MQTVFPPVFHQRDEFEDFVDPARVDSRSRLVQQRHIRMGFEQSGEGDELLLSERAIMGMPGMRHAGTDPHAIGIKLDQPWSGRP